MSKEESISERHDTINKRYLMRNIPSRPLQPYLDVRPVMTKYTTFPVIDKRRKATVEINQQPIYTPESVFNPGTSVAPWCGFATNVGTESELRNQTHQYSYSDRIVYVPSSKSDMYSYEWTKKTHSNQNTNPHVGLQHTGMNNISNNLKNTQSNDYLGTHVFYNSSRL